LEIFKRSVLTSIWLYPLIFRTLTLHKNKFFYSFIYCWCLCIGYNDYKFLICFLLCLRLWKMKLNNMIVLKWAMYFNQENSFWNYFINQNTTFDIFFMVEQCPLFKLKCYNLFWVQINGWKFWVSFVYANRTDLTVESSSSIFIM
jgi:hypothetical protein